MNGSASDGRRCAGRFGRQDEERSMADMFRMSEQNRLIDPEHLRPVGHWQLKPGCPYKAYECSRCHNYAIAGNTKYCPYCGAMMEAQKG